MHPDNSTNVRSEDWAAEIAALAAVEPEAAATAAAELFLTPPPRRPRMPIEQPLFERAERWEVRFEGERLPVYRFGRGPAVLLLHGWGGSSGQLHAFVEPLLERGGSVVAFDAPGHGEATGSWLAIPRYADAILRVVEEVGAIRAVIGHSMGAAATAFATSLGFAPQRAVLIGPPVSELEMFRAWARSLGFDEAQVERTRLRVEARVGIPFERLRAQPMAASVAAPVLVIHDRDDREVPWADGAALAAAAPNGWLISTEGLGHRRILRDPRVVQASADFALSTDLRRQSATSVDQFRRDVNPITGSHA